MRPSCRRPMTHRRGFTLVEMLVTVALLLLIMTVIVSIFQVATGAIELSQADQELSQGLRRFDQTLREDLAGATVRKAKFTPPLNPKDKLGYFEYSEGALADAQEEDTDDTIAMTVE